MLELTFFVLLGIIAYSYVFYSLLLYAVSLVFSRKPVAKPRYSDEELPNITLFVAAYNEIDFCEKKIANSLALDYPSDKLTHVWVTDGSDDGTPEIIREKFPQITLLHENQRNGKIGAVNRGMKLVQTPIVVFCDANTYLNPESLREIASYFISDPKVGCVAGEKKIFSYTKDHASGAGEGIYWKYESFIKRTESKLGSTLGAAGELFAIRTDLYEHVEKDTILDDFTISLRIAQKGYKIKYAPDAFAQESSSADVKEELKRKIRIASGGLQSAIRLKGLLNPFVYPEISFKFISHKILRWFVVPLCFIAVFVINIILAYDSIDANAYSILLMLQIAYYAMGLLGYILEKQKIRLKILFIPYYIVMMNYAAIAGVLRYMKGNQSVNWVRAQRQIIE